MANGWDNSGSLRHNTDAINDNNHIKNMMGQRNDTRMSDKYDLGYQYSIVGMDASKAETTIQTIDEYVQRIEAKARQINESADMDLALKSDVIQGSVKNYIGKVEEYCANLCSQLRFFRDRLQGANDAWKAHAETLSQTISTDTGSFDAGVHKQ